MSPVPQLREHLMAEKLDVPASTKADMTKIDGVRQALDDLGMDAQPIQIQNHLKRKYGLEMSTAHISNYKTFVSRERADKTTPTLVKPLTKKSIVKKAATTARPAAAAKTNRKATGRITLHDIEAVKGLVGRIERRDLKSLIDLLKK